MVLNFLASFTGRKVGRWAELAQFSTYILTRMTDLRTFLTEKRLPYKRITAYRTINK